MSGATENKILTLKRIKANQPCRSDEQEYDTNVLSSLHKDGYIKASVYTPIKTGIPKFLDMCIFRSNPDTDSGITRTVIPR